MDFTKQIKQKAIGLGFDLVGITDASPIEQTQRKAFEDYLQKGYAGQMVWLKNNIEKRINPSTLMKGTRSIIVVGLSYNRIVQQQDDNTIKPLGRVASFAHYQDYHVLIREKLRHLANWLAGATNSKFRCRVCVDTAPVAEKSLAQRAGLGFIGRNHILVNPKFGCRTLLGEIITNVELESDKAYCTDCNGCDECIRACPTGALRGDGQLDARRCVSYLTIEKKGKIKAEIAKLIGDRVFGCDDCTMACPYQKHSFTSCNKKLRFYPERACLDLTAIASTNSHEFGKLFYDSPIRHAGLERLKRNAKICLKNTVGK